MRIDIIWDPLLKIANMNFNFYSKYLCMYHFKLLILFNIKKNEKWLIFYMSEKGQNIDRAKDNNNSPFTIKCKNVHSSWQYRMYWLCQSIFNKVETGRIHTFGKYFLVVLQQVEMNFMFASIICIFFSSCIRLWLLKTWNGWWKNVFCIKTKKHYLVALCILNLKEKFTS